MDDSFQDFLKDTCDDYADTMMSDSSEDNDKQALKADLAKELPVAGDEDQRKTRRRLANRESARRTRQRKADMLKSLSTEVVKLTNRNFWLQARLANVTKQSQKVALENQILRQQLHELSMSAALQLQDIAPMLGLTPLDTNPHGQPLTAGKAPSPCPAPLKLDLFPPSLTCLPHVVTSATSPAISTVSPPLLPPAEASPATPVTPAAIASVPSIPSTPHSPLNNFSNPFTFPASPDVLPDLASYWTAAFGEDASWTA